MLTADPSRAVAAVTFLAVIREGIEAALFLLAVTTSSGGAQVVLGATVGIAIAVGLGALVYAGGRKLPMRTFFKVTGMVIVVFAAGLLARAVLFLQSAGDLETLAGSMYDVTGTAWLTQQSEVGKMLAALFGWDPRPSIEQVLAWVGYLVPLTYLFLRKPHQRPPAPHAAAGPPRAQPVGAGTAR